MIGVYYFFRTSFTLPFWMVIKFRASYEDTPAFGNKHMETRQISNKISWYTIFNQKLRNFAWFNKRIRLFFNSIVYNILHIHTLNIYFTSVFLRNNQNASASSCFLFVFNLSFVTDAMNQHKEHINKSKQIVEHITNKQIKIPKIARHQAQCMVQFDLVLPKWIVSDFFRWLSFWLIWR